MLQVCSALRKKFLSTPSARRATGLPLKLLTLDFNFYPRPPRGGRLHADHVLNQMQDFYPRPPRGGRLKKGKDVADYIVISIHALREEGDYID